MAVYDKRLEKYVAERYYSVDGTLLRGVGRSKAEAKWKLKDQIRRYKKQKLMKTDRRTLARPSLVGVINDEIAKEKGNETS